MRILQIPVNAHAPSIKDGTNLVLRSPFCAISILLVSDRAAHDKRDPLGPPWDEVAFSVTIAFSCGQQKNDSKKSS